MIKKLVVFFLIASGEAAFQCSDASLRHERSFSTFRVSRDGNEGDKPPLSKESGKWNPIKDLSGMISSMDDVIDDFMGKRMGNGEVFYGKRKYKPSGRMNTEGQYNGMGLSDKTRIDVARETKEYIMEQRKLRQEEEGRRR